LPSVFENLHYEWILVSVFGRDAEKRPVQRGCVVQTQYLLRKTSEKLGHVGWSQDLVSKVCWFLSSGPTFQ